MANPVHVDVVKGGAQALAEWQVSRQGERLDLRGAGLRGVDLHAATLHNADLSDADLTGANFHRADLVGAKFRNATLESAQLFRADLAVADLSCAMCRDADFESALLVRTCLAGANMQGAYLVGARLLGADLRNTNLTAAIFGQTTLDGLYLKDVVGLEKTKHVFESSVGLDTIINSLGSIPEAFLRGCGVPDAAIALVPRLGAEMEPIQFHSCFLSYSHKDEDFAKHLYGRLREEHLRVWFASQDMQAGRKMYDQINDAIHVHDKLLLVLSEESMTSEWVKTEVRRARRREIREKQQVLFPIRLVPMEAIKSWSAFDADNGKDLAVEVREYHIPDFSNWGDPAAFEEQFTRLLGDLKKSVERAITAPP